MYNLEQKSFSLRIWMNDWGFADVILVVKSTNPSQDHWEIVENL